MLADSDRSRPNGGNASTTRKSRRRLFYPKVTGVFLIGSVAYLLLQRLWGQGDQLSWALFGGAVVFALIGNLGWWFLSGVDFEKAAGTGRYGIRAWVGFPLSLFCFLGMIPLLVLALFPAARARLDPHDRIEATLVGEELRIRFPQRTLGQSVNLQIDDTPIPREYIEANPGTFAWDGHGTVLRIDLAKLKRDFELLEPQRVGLNALFRQPPIRDPTGRRIPQQWVTLEPD